MTLNAEITKWRNEARWFEAQARKAARSRKHDAATRAALVASFKGGERTALATVQRLQAEKCRLESQACVWALFGAR